MFNTKVILRATSEHIHKAILSRPLLLSGSQSTRLQTNAAAAPTDQPDELNSEWAQARPFEEIPHDTKWQTVRNFLPGGKFYKKDISEFMVVLHREFGDICAIPGVMGQPTSVLTFNPDDFERVFRNESIWPIRPGQESLNYYRSKYRADVFKGVEGILGTQGEKWGRFRSAVNPVLMQPKTVRLYLNKMARVNLELVERIRDIRDPKSLEVPATFEEELNRWTLESVSVVALDKQLGLLKENRNNPESKKLFDGLTVFFELTFDLDFGLSFWRYVSTPNFRRLMKGFDDIVEVCSKYVNEAIERLEKEAATGADRAEGEKSMLEKLLKIDKQIATVMAMDLLMAGVDTMSTSSTFFGVLLCMAKNPEKQAKLREEVYRLLPNKDSDFNEAALKNAPYLRACIKEAMRMYPLVGGNARVPQRDVVLSGFRIPKGTQVSMPTGELMRNEKHFPRANEYLPERWLRAPKGAEGGENALKPSNPFVYLPFGFGPRSCIGKRIVEMELELGLARIVRNFQVEYNHPTEKAFKSLLINVPNIPLTFKFTDVP